MRKLFFLLLALVVPLVLAVPVFAKETPKQVVLPKDEVVDHDYFAAGEMVTLLGTVNGDAYIAGGNITIDGTINGDLLVAGGNVTIRGKVTDDIRAAGGSITIASDVGKNVTIGGGNVTLSSDAKIAGSLVAGAGSLTVDAPVGRGSTIGGGQVTIANTVNGDIWAGTGSLTLSPDAKVNGNLHYISDNDASILPGAVVSGDTTRETPPQDAKRAQETGRAVASGVSAGFKFASLLSALVLGFLLTRLFPRFMESTSEQIRKNPWKVLGVGFLTYAVFPFVFILLLITLIGIPLALIFLFSTLVIAYVSKLFLAFFVGNWIMQKLNWKGGLMVALLLGLVAYYILTLVPVISALTFMAFLFMGTGSLLLTKKQYYNSLKAKNIL